MSTTTTIVESPKGALESTQPESVAYLLDWNDLPVWMKIDPLIQRGYRRQLNSFKACVESLFYTHNELVNIWSHLLPTLYYLTVLFVVDHPLTRKLAGANDGDAWVIQVYIAGTAACLFLSAFYHCTNAHSEKVACQTLKCDYVGTVLSITVTSIASTHLGLREEIYLRNTYFAASLLCAAAAIRTLLGPDTNGPGMAAWRTIVCAATIGAGWVPILQALITKGPSGTEKFPIVPLGFTMMCYFFGAMVYVARVPEKYWPRVFDIWGASHQIFHTLIAVGQMVFLFGIQRMVAEDSV